MERGTIPASDIPGGLDLQATLESGQSYCWRRTDEMMYAEANPPTGGDWYQTVIRAAASPTDQSEILRVQQGAEGLHWESTTDGAVLARRFLRLDDDLHSIRRKTCSDDLQETAWDAYRGLRLVDGPPFRTLVSFICSSQMRVERIHEMQISLAREYGVDVETEGQTIRTFPTPPRLSAVTESELRELGLGYRAPYVRETAEMVANGTSPKTAMDMAYPDAREWLTQYPGVGPKVADCICLFSLGFTQAVPIDTWIRSAIADHYPSCTHDKYAATSRAIREQLGGDNPASDSSGNVADSYAGYVQTYLFHYLRSRSRG